MTTSPSAWRPRPVEPYAESTHSLRMMRHLPSTICQARQGLVVKSSSPPSLPSPSQLPVRHISQHSSASLIVLNFIILPQLFVESSSQLLLGNSHEFESGRRPRGTVAFSPTRRSKPPLGTHRPPLCRFDASAAPAAWRQNITSVSSPQGSVCMIARPELMSRLPPRNFSRSTMQRPLSTPKRTARPPSARVAPSRPTAISQHASFGFCTWAPVSSTLTRPQSAASVFCQSSVAYVPPQPHSRLASFFIHPPAIDVLRPSTASAESCAHASAAGARPASAPSCVW